MSLNENISEITATVIQGRNEEDNILNPIQETEEFWTQMTVWALTSDCMGDREKNMMFSVSSILKNGRTFSTRQEKFRDDILEKALREGFVFEEK